MLNLLVALIALNSSPAQAEISVAQDAIYNGYADDEAWRSTVALRFNSGSCTGTFVEENVILTAAHCQISDSSDLELTMYRENSPFSSEVTYIRSGGFRYVAHPSFRSNSIGVGVDDIAVIYLKNNFIPAGGFLMAKILRQEQASAARQGSAAYAMGFGTTGDDHKAMNLTVAQGTISRYEPQDIIRVDYNSSGTCPGDSGGPVFVKYDGELYLMALISSGYRNIGGNCSTTTFADTLSGVRVDWYQQTVREIQSGRR